jgi:hypothetical protein
MPGFALLLPLRLKSVEAFIMLGVLAAGSTVQAGLEPVGIVIAQ